MKKKEEVTKLLWLDMEMTGLVVEKERPIEIAAIVTDWSFQPVAEFHQIIYQPPALLEAMDDWNQKHHKQSGLLDQIPQGAKIDFCDKELAQFITANFNGERAILAGNSINQDRLFIRAYLPETEALLHYRMLDVTSWKVVLNSLYQKKFKKIEAHRAQDDIRESIAEFQYYLSFVKP